MTTTRVWRLLPRRDGDQPRRRHASSKERQGGGRCRKQDVAVLDSEAVGQLNDKFANKSSTQKSNTSFAAQYAKAEESAFAMLKDEMDFKKTMETERLKFEQRNLRGGEGARTRAGEERGAT